MRILVGVDGSPNSAAALRWAVELAETLRADVVAVHAVGLLEHERGSSAQREPDWDSLGVASHPAMSRLARHGSPADVLIGVGDELDAGLLVVGRRGAGLTGLTLGSTSLQVAQRATRPVAVIPL